MKSKKIIAFASALLIAGGFSGGLTGCSSANNDAEEQKESYEISRTTDYEDLAGIEADSELVIVAEVSDDYELMTLSGMTFTERVVYPSETLKGENHAEVTVVEIGSPDAENALEPGTTHLFFLNEYELTPGVPTGKYVVTGVFAGDYLQIGDETFEKVDEESPSLPEELAPEEVVEMIEVAEAPE